VAGHKLFVASDAIQCRFSCFGKNELMEQTYIPVLSSRRLRLRSPRGRETRKLLLDSFLPVADGPVRIKDSLDDFLLEGVFGDLGFIDLNSQSWLGIGPDDPADRFDGKTLSHNVTAPWHVSVNGFTDQITGL
jgi:hypothetical protein